MISTQLLAHPEWIKTCAEQCKNDKQYLIAGGKILCAKCKEPVKTKYQEEMRLNHIAVSKLLSHPKKPSQETDDTASKVSPDPISQSKPEEIDAPLFVLDKQRELMLLSVLTEDRLRFDRGGKPAEVSDNDVSIMHSKWIEAGSNAHPLDRMTATILSHWPSDIELELVSITSLEDLKTPFLLSNKSLIYATTATMVLIDIMQEDKELKPLVANQENMNAVAKYYCSKQQHVDLKIALSSRQSAAKTFSPKADRQAIADLASLNMNTVSQRFANMQFSSPYRLLAKGTLQWDKDFENLIKTLKVPDKDRETFTQLVYMAEKKTQVLPCTKVSFRNIEQGLTPSDESAFFLIPDDAENPESLPIMQVLTAMPEGQLLQLVLGEIRWFVRKAVDGTYQIYLPTFIRITQNDALSTAQTLGRLYHATFDPLKELAKAEYDIIISVKEGIQSIPHIDFGWPRNKLFARGAEVLSDPRFQAGLILFAGTGIAYAVNHFSK